MRIACAIFVGILFPAAVNAAPPTGPLRSAIEKEVKTELRDPSSAQFEHLNYKGGDFYCGYVNAKNGFGGYGGKKMFLVMVADKKKPLIALVGIDTGSGAVEEMCAKEGAI